MAIKDKGETQLEAIKNYDARKELFKELESLDEKQQQKKENKLVHKLRQINNKIETEKKDVNLLCVHRNGREYNFNKFTLLERFYYDILFGRVKIGKVKDEQNEIDKEISDFKKDNPTN